MAARIIGKEGANIHAFERVTGASLMVSDGHRRNVKVTHFHPVARHLAVRTLNELMRGGTIYPYLIESTYDKLRAHLDAEYPRWGAEAAAELQVLDVPDEVLSRLGQLRFVIVEGQDALTLAILGARVADLLARELAVDAQEARRAALLRDVGMTAPAGSPGDHALAGASLLEAVGESPQICEAVRLHHSPAWAAGERGALSAVVHTAETLVHAAAAVSSHVPGSIHRARQVEQLCRSFPGVLRVAALHTGEGLEVLVDPDQVGEGDLVKLARNVAILIRDQAGQLPRVTVLRKTAAIARASWDGVALAETVSADEG